MRRHRATSVRLPIPVVAELGGLGRVDTVEPNAFAMDFDSVAIDYGRTPSQGCFPSGCAGRKKVGTIVDGCSGEEYCGDGYPGAARNPSPATPCVGGLLSCALESDDFAQPIPHGFKSKSSYRGDGCPTEQVSGWLSDGSLYPTEAPE
jgi:hypothetical protein